MLVCAAVCPHPPLLVPELAAGAAAELDGLRAACDEAVRRLAQTQPDLIVAVGPAPKGTGVREYGATARPRFSGYGLPRRDKAGGEVVLPLSLSVGAWLLQRSGWTGERCFLAVATDLDGETCRETGRWLAERAARVGLLVLGDGSARRSGKAPGYVDARAAAYDDEVTRTLEHADVDALMKLDVTLAADLLVAGRPAWQVLASAAASLDVDATLLANEAPYGVGYFVATWTAR